MRRRSGARIFATAAVRLAQFRLPTVALAKVGSDFVQQLQPTRVRDRAAFRAQKNSKSRCESVVHCGSRKPAESRRTAGVTGNPDEGGYSMSTLAENTAHLTPEQTQRICEEAPFQRRAFGDESLGTRMRGLLDRIEHVSDT